MGLPTVIPIVLYGENILDAFLICMALRGTVACHVS